MKYLLKYIWKLHINFIKYWNLISELFIIYVRYHNMKEYIYKGKRVNLVEVFKDKLVKSYVNDLFKNNYKTLEEAERVTNHKIDLEII